MIFTDEVMKTHCCSDNHLLLGHWITWHFKRILHFIFHTRKAHSTTLRILVDVGLLVGSRAASRLLLLVVGGQAADSAGQRPGGVEAAGGRAMLRQLARGQRRARPAARRPADLGVGDVPSRSRGVSGEWMEPPDEWIGRSLYARWQFRRKYAQVQGEVEQPNR
jgi:hypothetical protein